MIPDWRYKHLGFELEDLFLESRVRIKRLYKVVQETGETLSAWMIPICSWLEIVTCPKYMLMPSKRPKIRQRRQKIRHWAELVVFHTSSQEGRSIERLLSPVSFQQFYRVRRLRGSGFQAKMDWVRSHKMMRRGVRPLVELDILSVRHARDLTQWQE